MSNRSTSRKQGSRSQEPRIVNHFDGLPEGDVTTYNGMPITTPVRTVLDIAPDLDDDHLLRRIVDSAVRRGSLTVEQLLERASEPDMRDRPGARRVQQLFGTS